MKLEIAIEQMRDVLRRKHLSLATEQSYIGWLTRFSKFIMARCSPDQKPEAKMEMFLTQLARQDVAASTQNGAFCALLFFYREVLKVEIGKVDSLRAKKPVHLRFAPEASEVRQLIAGLQDVGGSVSYTHLRAHET
jgi:site-specific recombinase XerD